MIFIAILTGISIVLSMSYSNFIVTSENHKVAEMYIGTLKYSITIDGSTTNTLSVPSGETIVDVTITNENPIDTYYKLIYQNNSNVSITYYEGYELNDSNNISNSYDSPSDKILNSVTKTLKLKILNNSTTSQTITFKITGGFATNTLDDVTVPTGYTIIEKDTSTNTYFCTTTDTLTQGLQYVNGQYTYAYRQQGDYSSSGLGWSNISNNSWGVQQTDKTSTDAVTSKVCTYINNKPITSMSKMFSGSQATTLDVSNFNTSKITNMNFMFEKSQTKTLDLSNFDTSNVTNMYSMFYNSQATTLDLSNFDTSNVTGMSSMFFNSKATILNVSNFDTSNVINMSGMFQGIQATTLDVSNFDTSSVTNMSGMFQSSQATTLDVSNFDTSKVTDMSYMFSGSQVTTLDLSNFDTLNVKYMSAMFQYSKTTTLDLSNFNTSKVTSMSYMFYNANNLKTIYVSDKFNTDNVTTSTSMFSISTSLVGGAGTKYNSSYVDKTYAHIDGGTNNPGYFTDIADKPSTFPTDSWETIAASVKAGNSRGYKVGETKTIDMGTYGTHTLRIANTTTPSECSTTGFSQSACGFVLEFADIITTHNMNSSGTYKGTEYADGWNKDGWPASNMHTFVNNDIYNALPSELKNIIINTTVVSGHGKEDTSNFTSTDKLYLLSTTEIWKESTSNPIQYDSAKNLTRQLDYYKKINTTTTNYTGAIKKYNSNDIMWFLRTANSGDENYFYLVTTLGDWGNNTARSSNGVSPAFRIG